MSNQKKPYGSGVYPIIEGDFLTKENIGKETDKAV